jgi:BirA family biotin operon repressor/biotin-[acetyl-CoA-carboxylase] ligase
MQVAHSENFDAEIYHFKSLTSTQDVIKQILLHRNKNYHSSNSKRRLLAVLADCQTRGRGRIPGRIWYSPPGGNFYGTIGLEFVWSASKLSHFPFLTLCALIDVLKDCLPSELIKSVSAKWPNDIFLEGKKLGGILTELWKDEDNNSWLLIGIGLNIALSIQGAAKLLDYTKKEIESKILLHRLVSSLYSVIDEYNKNGFEPIRQKWLRFGWKLGEMISVNNDEHVGRFSDIGDDGSLILHDDNGHEVRVFYGSIN